MAVVLFLPRALHLDWLDSAPSLTSAGYQGLSLGVKWPQRDAGHSTPSRVFVKTTQIYKSYLRIGNFTFYTESLYKFTSFIIHYLLSCPQSWLVLLQALSTSMPASTRTQRDPPLSPLLSSTVQLA